MALVSMQEIFAAVPKGAAGAYTVHNMEYVQAVVKAAELEETPVILLLGEPIIDYAGFEMLTEIALLAAKQSALPICVMLDHGMREENLLGCVKKGISIMIDYSSLPLSENIEKTRRYAYLAHEHGVSAEGELGAVGRAEGISSAMTDPDAIAEFCERTGIDSVAVGVGSQHGVYASEPKLDFELLKVLHRNTPTPLVLHGGSGLTDEMFRGCIEHGVRKINIGTDLKIQFSKTMRERLHGDPILFQPWDTLGCAREAVTEATRVKMRIFRG